MIETKNSSTATTTTEAHQTPNGPGGEAPPPPARRSGLPVPLRVAIVLVVLGTVAGLAWYFFIRVPPPPPGVVFVSGRIEGDDAVVAAKVAGRIKEIRVREGDTVKEGDVLAILADDQIRAREQAAQSAVDQAEARVSRTRQQIAVLQEQLRQSQLGVDQARIDAQGRVSQAQAQVASSEAALAQAEANYDQAKYDAERFSRLAEEGIEPQRVAHQAQKQAEAQAAAVRAARKQVDVARGALETARANLANPAIRSAGASAVEQQIVQAQSDVAAAEADADRARAQLDEARANRSDLTVVAPFAGTISTRTAEPGEVVAVGTPILTLVDLSKVYLRAFVPEGEIGKVKVDQPARVYLDSAPNTPVDAYVSRIDPEASFTPENTYFRDERVKQVVGVKLQLRGAVGAAKPGMPADGEIRVEGESWPNTERPR